MDVSAALVAHPQPAELVQPPQGPLHHPPVHSEPAAMCCAPPSQRRRNVARPQFLPMLSRVIGPVGVPPLGTAAGTAPLTSHWRHGIHQGQQLGYVVAIGSGHDGRKWRSLGLGEHVMLAPRLAPVRRIGTRLFPRPPRLAPTRCPRKPATSPGSPRRAIGTTAFHGALPTRPLPANPAAGASRSSPSRIPSPGAAFPRECRSSTRTECRSGLCGRPGTCVPDCGTAAVWGWAAAVVRSPTARRLPKVSPSGRAPTFRSYGANAPQRNGLPTRLAA